MTSLILDGVLMLLLVAALAYGVRLERKLSQLRAGQTAFASAVNDLNTAAGRAEAALASLRACGEEADLLHDRIQKARTLKQELEALTAQGRGVERVTPPPPMPPQAPVLIRAQSATTRPDLLDPEPAPVAPARFDVGAALAASRSARESLARARRGLDEDLFAA